MLLPVLGVQKILEALDQDPCIALERLTEGHQDPLQEFFPAPRRIRNQANIDDFGIELLEKMADKRRLPGTDLTSNDRKTGVVHDAEFKHSKSQTMGLTPVNQVWIGQNRKRF